MYELQWLYNYSITNQWCWSRTKTQKGIAQQIYFHLQIIIIIIIIMFIVGLFTPSHHTQQPQPQIWDLRSDSQTNTINHTLASGIQLVSFHKQNGLFIKHTMEMDRLTDVHKYSAFHNYRVLYFMINEIKYAGTKANLSWIISDQQLPRNASEPTIAHPGFKYSNPQKSPKTASLMLASRV